jgi:hypothetical protein
MKKQQVGKRAALVDENRTSGYQDRYTNTISKGSKLVAVRNCAYYSAWNGLSDVA